MDVLSDAVAALRTGRPHVTRYELYPPWGMRIPASGGGGFHVVLQGSCWLVSPPGPPVALGAGDVVFVRGRTTHGLADQPSSPLTDIRLHHDRLPYREVRGEGSGSATVVLCGAYTLDETRAHPLLSEVPPVMHLAAQVGRHSSLRAAIDLLGGELQQPRPGIGAVVPALLDTLVLYILRTWFEERSRAEGATGWAAALNDPSIAAALSAIHENPDHPWRVEDLGTRAGLSRAAFARRFTALVGQPPLTYLTWWRMTVAARLLRTSDAPVRATGRRVGYTSEIAFAAAFKRQYGISPARYRDHDAARPPGNHS